MTKPKVVGICALFALLQACGGTRSLESLTTEMAEQDSYSSAGMALWREAIARYTRENEPTSVVACIGMPPDAAEGELALPLIRPNEVADVPATVLNSVKRDHPGIRKWSECTVPTGSESALVSVPRVRLTRARAILVWVRNVSMPNDSVAVGTIGYIASYQTMYEDLCHLRRRAAEWAISSCDRTIES